MNRSRTSNDAPPRGRVVVLTGPSGVGKTTVSQRLLTDPRLLRVITATTRPPRPGEVDGCDYLFLSRTAFVQRRERGEFLEWAVVYDEFYGTPLAQVEAVVASGKDALLVIDVQGAGQVKQARPEALFLFLLPPDLETLEKRLAGRGTERDAQVEGRLDQAAREMAEADWFDHCVVNDEVEKAVEALRAILWPD